MALSLSVACIDIQLHGVFLPQVIHMSLNSGSFIYVNSTQMTKTHYYTLDGSWLVKACGNHVWGGVYIFCMYRNLCEMKYIPQYTQNISTYHRMHFHSILYVIIHRVNHLLCICSDQTITELLVWFQPLVLRSTY